MDRRDIEKALLDLVDEGYVECNIINGIRYYSAGRYERRLHEDDGGDPQPNVEGTLQSG